MDFKEIAKKVVEGGNADELTKGLDPKGQADVWNEVGSLRKKEADAELAKTEAIRKERQRLEGDVDGTRRAAADDIRNQLRGEQIDIALDIAENRLITKGIKLSPEEKTNLKNSFKTFDSGKFDASLIASDFLRAYGALNAEKLIDDSSQRFSMERGASEFNSGSAAAGSAGAGTPPEPPMSSSVKAALQAAQKYGVPLSREEAERAEKRGTDWKVIGPKPKA